MSLRNDFPVTQQECTNLYDEILRAMDWERLVQLQDHMCRLGLSVTEGRKPLTQEQQDNVDSVYKKRAISSREQKVLAKDEPSVLGKGEVTKTLDEVKAEIEAYAKDATDDAFMDLIKSIAQLDSELTREVALKELVAHKDKHGLSLTKLRACVKEERASETDGADAFFEGTTFKPMRVFNALHEKFDFLTVNTDDVLRLYEGGVYWEDKILVTEKTIIEMLGDRVTSAHVSDVIKLLKSYSTDFMPMHTDWVNLENGRLCLDTWKLLEHSPEEKSVIQLPIQYDANAKCPVFDNWLKDVLPAHDDQALLLQLIGYSMLQDLRFGKFAVLYGPTHTGKSTCLHILSHFLGKKNVSSQSLHALDNEQMRFSRACLFGKLANISGDLSSKYLSGDSQVKMIVSGDEVTLENKGLPPFGARLFATLWASCNDLPVSHDRSDAWYERLVILPFFQQHKGDKADREMVGRIVSSDEEMSGILNRVIDALQCLFLMNRFIETESTRNMLAEYKLENDHVSRFLAESYEVERGAQAHEDDVYDYYKEWAESEGIAKPLSKTKFRDGVERFLGVGRKRLNRDGKRYFVFEGLHPLGHD